MAFIRSSIGLRPEALTVLLRKGLFLSRLCLSKCSYGDFGSPILLAVSGGGGPDLLS